MRNHMQRPSWVTVSSSPDGRHVRNGRRRVKKVFCHSCRRRLFLRLAMAMRAVFHRSKVGDISCLFSQTRLSHAIALPAPSYHAIDSPTVPPLCLPEDGYILENRNGFQFPDFASGGEYMELMAVPKKKVSSHKRGIRNGPRALKPIPVIIRCKNCGQVKLPHFYCCGGRREETVDK